MVNFAVHCTYNLTRQWWNCSLFVRALLSFYLPNNCTHTIYQKLHSLCCTFATFRQQSKRAPISSQVSLYFLAAAVRCFVSMCQPFSPQGQRLMLVQRHSCLVLDCVARSVSSCFIHRAGASPLTFFYSNGSHPGHVICSPI